MADKITSLAQSLTALLSEIVSNEVADHTRRAALQLLQATVSHVRGDFTTMVSTLEVAAEVFSDKMLMPWLGVDCMLYCVQVSSLPATLQHRSLFTALRLALAGNDFVRLQQSLIACQDVPFDGCETLQLLREACQHVLQCDWAWFSRSTRLRIARIASCSEVQDEKEKCVGLTNLFDSLARRGLGV